MNQAIFESILIVALCGYITFNHNFVFETWGQQVQSWTAILCFVAYLAIPLFCLLKLMRNFNHINEEY